uniref:phospholipase A2 inhibitor-like n=1 Tax=Ciona intestinalis TaxID=7719 RepID=UPI000180C562|nr:phospholipase A2 inhibitor-like [Ciona intestinalis]|eukprot:XP_002124630.1 phospholipase A2 inhibitor-like [Ciona intestinalis]
MLGVFIFLSMLKLSKAYTCLGGCNCSTDVVTSGIEVYCRGKNMHRIPAEALAREAWGSVVIDFGLNELSALPANAFRGQTKLKRLILDHNDIEKVDPACFNATDRAWEPRKSPLEYINMRDNHLHFIPPCFGKTATSVSELTNLRTLYLGGNKLGNTPESDSLVGVPNVQDLDLSRNLMPKLPELFLKKLPKLLYLDISINKITKLPRSVLGRTVQLLTLSANGNMFRSIPQKLPTSLIEIQLANNAIKNLTSLDMDALYDLEHLVVLDLSGNGIEFIFNGVFSRLANLKVLDLSQNSLDSVSAATFDGLRNLEALFLQNNPTLNYIPATTFTNLPRLKYLFLYGCGLRSVSIPDTGLNVKYIWLFGNPLNCNCRLVSLAMYLQTSKVILDSGLEKLEVDTGNPRGDAAVRVKLNSIRVKIMPTICVSPTNRHRSVVGIPVAKIPVGSLTCPDEPVYIIVSVFLGIICFALSVPVVFCLVGAYLLVLKLGKTKFGWKLNDEDE